MSLKPTQHFAKTQLGYPGTAVTDDVHLIVRSVETVTLGTGALSQTIGVVASNELRPLSDITVVVTGGQFTADATLTISSSNHRHGDLISVVYLPSDIPNGRNLFIKDDRNGNTLATLTNASSGLLRLSLDATLNAWVVTETLESLDANPIFNSVTITGSGASVKILRTDAAQNEFQAQNSAGTAQFGILTSGIGFAGTSTATDFQVFRNSVLGITLGASSLVTLAGNLVVSGGTITGPAGTDTMVVSGATRSILLQTNGGTTALTLDASQNATFAGLVNVPSAGYYGFATRGTIQASADGIFTLLNNAGSNFSRIQLGGTSASFPAIKRNATALNFRLADDSADAPITGAAGTFSGIIQSAGQIKAIAVKTTTYTVTTADHVIVGNHATTAFTITLIAASTNTGQEFVIKNKGAAVVTVSATGLGQIDGANSVTLNQYQSITVVSDGATWNTV